MDLIDGLISQWLANNNGDDSIGPHDMLSVSPSGYSIDAKLGSHALIYDGIDDKSIIANHSDFIFGDGVSDSPFSIFQWVKMTDATKFRLFYKNLDGPNAEYAFSTNSSDKLTVELYDQNVSNKISRASSISLTGDQGTYILVGFTYDGSGLASGIRMYLGNGSGMKRLATTDTSAGSYTAIHSLSGDIWLGAGQFGGFAKGLIDTGYIWNRVLSDGGVSGGSSVESDSDIGLLWNGGAGIEITTVSGLSILRRRIEGH